MPMSAHPSATVPALQLRFWGVRGSIPTPAAENMKYGGNTACLEVRTPSGESLIFDGGTGIRPLSMQMVAEGRPVRRTNIFLTHFHWDHLQGLPFFAPLYDENNHVVFHSSHPVAHLRDVLAGQMATPYFPMQFERLGSRMHFSQVHAEPEDFGGVSVSCFPLHHPQGASGYRIACGAAVIVYASDHEHGNAEVDRGLRDVARGADVLVYDAQFTPEEYAARQGWGHSTWLEATRVARDAGVKQLVLFHHDPNHDDAMMEHILEDAGKHFGNTSLAREGQRLFLPV
jgi:phosphoribosyl 1,2-cyclic phosphodiesterase